MNNFEDLCESIGIMKTVKNERYPRAIKFSEGFLESLKEEFYSHKLKLEENSEKPIKHYCEKFQKALRFELSHLNSNIDAELDAMRAKFDEQNDQRVPEVKIDGEELELPQNEAEPNTEPKKQELCKGKRLVLKRNVSKETEVKEAYGTKRDHPKQEIHLNGKYKATTTWAKNGKQAKEEYLKTNPKVDPKSVRVFRKEVK